MKPLLASFFWKKIASNRPQIAAGSHWGCIRSILGEVHGWHFFDHLSPWGVWDSLRNAPKTAKSGILWSRYLGGKCEFPEIHGSDCRPWWGVWETRVKIWPTPKLSENRLVRQKRKMVIFACFWPFLAVFDYKFRRKSVKNLLKWRKKPFGRYMEWTRGTYHHLKKKRKTA